MMLRPSSARPISLQEDYQHWSQFLENMGCDVSVLLNSTDSTSAEREAHVNFSLQGLKEVDEIKAALDYACLGVVSCADLLILAAREATFIVDGNLLFPVFPFDILVANFARKNFNVWEMVVLSDTGALASWGAAEFGQVGHKEATGSVDFVKGTALHKGKVKRLKIGKYKKLESQGRFIERTGGSKPGDWDSKLGRWQSNLLLLLEPNCSRWRVKYIYISLSLPVANLFINFADALSLFLWKELERALQVCRKELETTLQQGRSYFQKDEGERVCAVVVFWRLSTVLCIDGNARIDMSVEEGQVERKRLFTVRDWLKKEGEYCVSDVWNDVWKRSEKLIECRLSKDCFMGKLFRVGQAFRSSPEKLIKRQKDFYLLYDPRFRMDSQSRRQRTVDRKRTDQLGQSSRRIAQANEDRLRLRRQRYAEQKAERRAASSSQDVSSGSQRGIRRKVLEMVDKLKSLSGESVEYESKILTRFLKHSSISKALKVGSIMSLKEQHVAKLLLAKLATDLQTVKRTHTQDEMIHDDCKEMCREMGWGETAELGELVLNWWTQ
ncbi:hypothetical protein R1sor_006422 [Riccia sorocarpa]|uniref:Plant heme peroxidase family profile domain-containing protein n=1 Tax=Riccia sorocarpa TaxID=122646 RepID=A0ABD3HRL9_9MARC